MPRSWRTERSIFLGALAAAVLLVGAPRLVGAVCSVTYSGPNGGTWNTAGNWNPSGVPMSNQVACIPSGLTVVIGNGVAATALRIGADAGSGVQIQAGGALVLTDAMAADTSTFGDLSVALNGLLSSPNLGQAVQVSGTAIVDGTLQAVVTLLSGSVSGTGTIQGLLNSGGTVRPGGAGVVGELHVAQTYSQGPGGTLELDVASDASFDEITAVAGNANIGGTIVVNLLGGYLPTVGTMWQIIPQTGGSLFAPSAIVPPQFGVHSVSMGGVLELLMPLTSATTTTTLAGGAITTTTHPSVTTTTLPTAGGAEVCGDCLDNDGDGAVDFEDDACCAGGKTTIVVRKGKIHPVKGTSSLVQLDTTIPAGAGIDALSQDVYVQLRTTSGKQLLCLHVPATSFKKVHKVVTFRDRKDTVASARSIDGVEFRKKGAGLLVHLEGKKLGFTTPKETDLVLTLGFRKASQAEAGNRCAGGVQKFKSPKGKDLLFP